MMPVKAMPPGRATKKLRAGIQKRLKSFNYDMVFLSL